MVIVDHSVLANEKSAASKKTTVLFPIHPNRKVLPGFSALNVHVHAFEHLASF